MFAMDNRLYCLKCDRECAYPVHGEWTEIIAHVSYCKHCGEQIFNKELDEANLQEAYRKKI
jgi:uncharacterized protein YktA (UPF0223 family)